MSLETSHLSTFEMECVNLLCRLDCHLEGLAGSNGPRFESVDVAKNMLSEVIEFVTSQYPDRPPALLERFTSVGAATKTFESQLLRSSWNVLRYVRKGSKSATELANAYSELHHNYVTLFSEFFVACAHKFQDANERQSFLASGGALITEFTKRW